MKSNQRMSGIIILGLLVAVGRYTGYRLVELIRFRELSQS